MVARFEPENHVHLIVDGFVRSGSQLPLIVVGSAPYSNRYTSAVHALADARVRFVGGIWDQELLDQLYANALVYWHGHSVGGTNPSLLRAIGSGTATNAFDVGFNREVLEHSGRYFSDPQDVAGLVADAERPGSDVAARGEQARLIAHRYNWDLVTDGYEELCHDLARLRAHSARGAYRRPSARLGPANLRSRPVTAIDSHVERAAAGYWDTVRALSVGQKTAARSAPAYSRYINRRLGRLLAAAAMRAGLGPNAVTAISAAFTFAGIALLMIFPPSGALGIGVALCLVVGYAFDSADGQVARMRGGGSPAGEWLDHMVDAVKTSTMPLALAVGLYRFGAVDRWWLVVPLGAAIVSAVLFFGMILTEQLRRQTGRVSVADPGGRSWIRSLLVIPMDYGVLCLSFLSYGVLPCLPHRLHADLRRHSRVPGVGVSEVVP